MARVCPVGQTCELDTVCYEDAFGGIGAEEQGGDGRMKVMAIRDYAEERGGLIGGFCGYEACEARIAVVERCHCVEGVS